MGTSISEAAASSRKLPVPAEQPPFRSEGGAPLAKRDRAGAAQSQRTELIDGNLHIGGRGFFQKASRARRTAVIQIGRRRPARQTRSGWCCSKPAHRVDRWEPPYRRPRLLPESFPCPPNSRHSSRSPPGCRLRELRTWHPGRRSQTAYPPPARLREPHARAAPETLSRTGKHTTGL